MNLCTLVLTLAIAAPGLAQQSGLKPLPLDDLSAFRNQAGNWTIVGDVAMNPAVDVSHKEEAPAAPAKKGKKSKSEKVAETPKAVTSGAGKGVLLNMNDDTRKDHLVTAFEHGDIELELEVMLPKGSNSGLYLQGRYELQLFDSWGVRSPKFSDMGGIYRNWESDPARIYMGKAPLTNAAKAPGLWQKLRVSFRAPKFDQNGNKISNARFVSVVLNGVEIHSNVEVPRPTGGPIENNEKPLGPIMIQGDHGPVALRNIRYRLMKDINVTLAPVAYDIYHGTFETFSAIASAKPVLSARNTELSNDVLDVDNGYAIRHTTEISVPEDGRYTFTATYTGGGRLSVNNKELFSRPTPDSWRRDTASIVLSKGTYPVEFVNYKTASWLPPRLALSVQMPGTYPKDLHGINSFPPEDDPTSAILVSPGKDPRILRAFLDFKGNRRERLTHTVGVGDPSGLHYVYDLKSGNLVCVWRGDFIDATPMWHDRGDGSFRPRGAALYLFNAQPFAYLSAENAPFPAVAQDGEFKGKGYYIEEQTNRPIFTYQYQGLDVEDRVFPDQDNKVISHEVTVKKGTRKDGLYYKLAEGTSIDPMPDGSFAVNGREYYVRPGMGSRPFVREVNGKKELVTAFPQQSLRYSIIW